MRRLLSCGVALALLTAALAGCESTSSDFGFAEESPTAREIAKPVGSLPTPGDKIVVDDGYEIFEITRIVGGSTETFRVLFGANPGYSGPVTAWLPDGASTPFTIESGFAYAEGTEPRAQSTRVSATGHGTVMIIQAVDTDLDRIFFLQGELVAAQSRNVPPDKDPGDAPYYDELDMIYTYFEIDDSGELQGPKQVKDDMAVREFVIKAIDLATVAGLDAPTAPVPSP